jgi:4-oxalocrotonate tautomerase
MRCAPKGCRPEASAHRRQDACAVDSIHQERTSMPYVNIKITREGATREQKAELIRSVTELLVRVLNKNPATTFVIIDEVDTDHWGIAGETVTVLRGGAPKGVS